MDISSILNGWPYEPGQISARKISGKDGHEKIQLRLELGLMQMETAGRPDGDCPHGCESLLEYYQKQLRRHRRERGSEDGFDLDERAAELLRTESTMYYHRYLAGFVLEDYASVERDTIHNLRLMDFCNAYAKEESDRYVLEQYRPYVLMMCARARGRRSLKDNRPKAALAAVKKGVEKIKDFYVRFGQEDLVEASGEIAILEAMAKEIELRIPVDPIKKLRRKLAQAVNDERYEEAALLRDQLHKATGQDPAGPVRS